MSRLVTRAILPFVIVVASGGAGYFLFQWRDAPSKKSAEDKPGVAVETVVVRRDIHTKDVTASGTVIPARQLEVYPQASGRLSWLYESLDPGTFVDEGQILFRIEATDYRNEIAELEAAVEQARAQLTVAESRHEAANEEWQHYRRNLPGEEGEASAVALREPQLSEARARVEAAEARLARARTNLSRTRFRAPFDAVITASNAEIGQLAGAQTRVVRLVGTRKFRARVALRTDQLQYIAIPGIDGTQGSDATVRQHIGDRDVVRSGRVLRLLSDREPASRMARVVVEIDDPYGLEESAGADGRPYPILLDTFVDVTIEGKHSAKLVALPREALRSGDRAFVFDPSDERLDIRELTVEWRRPESVLVSKGVEEGERVVVSPIATPVAGMKLREVNRRGSKPIGERSSVDG